MTLLIVQKRNIGFHHNGNDVQLGPQPRTKIGTLLVQLGSDTGPEDFAHMLFSVVLDLRDNVIDDPVPFGAWLFFYCDAMDREIHAIRAVVHCETDVDRLFIFLLDCYSGP